MREDRTRDSGGDGPVLLNGESRRYLLLSHHSGRELQVRRRGLCDEAKAGERTAAMRPRRRGRGSVLQLSLPQREEGALRIGAYRDPALWEGDRAGVHLSTELFQLAHRGI